MPHFKCSACRIRLQSPGGRESKGDLCPGCGDLLEPVGELSEIVGFQAAAPQAVADESSPAYQRLASRIDEIRSARAARDHQLALDAERWLDDGGSFSPEAVAVAVALPTPKIDS